MTPGPTSAVLEILDTGSQLTAHENQVIHATASYDGAFWYIQLRSGDGYQAASKDAARRALEPLVSITVQGYDLCDDKTCCLMCEHHGDEHDAGECWTKPDGVQCTCDWYHPAGVQHRHVAPTTGAAS